MEQKKVIDRIAASGIQKLTFAGGEPLLISGLEELVLYAKRKGQRTIAGTGLGKVSGKIGRFYVRLGLRPQFLMKPNLRMSKELSNQIGLVLETFEMP